MAAVLTAHHPEKLKLKAYLVGESGQTFSCGYSPSGYCEYWQASTVLLGLPCQRADCMEGK